MPGEQETAVIEIPTMEPPDDAIRRILGVYEPVLAMAIEELMNRGYPGWGGFMAVHYAVINDIMGAAA